MMKFGGILGRRPDSHVGSLLKFTADCAALTVRLTHPLPVMISYDAPAHLRAPPFIDPCSPCACKYQISSDFASRRPASAAAVLSEQQYRLGDNLGWKWKACGSTLPAAMTTNGAPTECCALQPGPSRCALPPGPSQRVCVERP